MTDLTQSIGGEAPSGEAAFDSISPSDIKDVVARYPAGSAADVDAAVAAARTAFNARSATSARGQGFAAVEFYTQMETVYVGG